MLDQYRMRMRAVVSELSAVRTKALIKSCAGRTMQPDSPRISLPTPATGCGCVGRESLRNIDQAEKRHRPQKPFPSPTCREAADRGLHRSL